MAKNIQDSRIVTKRSTVTTEIPTVPASNDHTDGTWNVTDVYKGELFINTVDEKMYTRMDDDSIVPIMVNNKSNGLNITMKTGDSITSENGVNTLSFSSVLAKLEAGANDIVIQATHQAGVTSEVYLGSVNSSFYLDGLNDIIKMNAPNGIAFGLASTHNANLKLYNETNSFFVRIKPGTTANDITYILPITDPTAGQVLTASVPVANVSTLSWTTPTTGTVTSVSGTTNRITSTGGATPVIDISASYVGQTSLTTLGTIATGVWQGTSIGTTYTDAKIKGAATSGRILYASATDTAATDAAMLFTSTNGGFINITQNVITGTGANMLTLTSAAHTSLTASAELRILNIVGATQQRLAGTLTNQRDVYITPNTLAFTSASTVGLASTLSIASAPIAGTNATITAKWALNIEDGGLNVTKNIASDFSAVFTNGTNLGFGIKSFVLDNTNTTLEGGRNSVTSENSSSTSNTWASILFRNNAVNNGYIGTQLLASTHSKLQFNVRSNNLTTNVGFTMLGQAASNVVLIGVGSITTPTSSMHLPASVEASASLTVPHGTAPSSPVNGDIWTDTSGMYVRINGVTKTVTLT